MPPSKLRRRFHFGGFGEPVALVVVSMVLYSGAEPVERAGHGEGSRARHLRERIAQPLSPVLASVYDHPPLMETSSMATMLAISTEARNADREGAHLEGQARDPAWPSVVPDFARPGRRDQSLPVRHQFVFVGHEH